MTTSGDSIVRPIDPALRPFGMISADRHPGVFDHLENQSRRWDIEKPRLVFAATYDVPETDHGIVVEHVTNTEYVRWIDRIAELDADQSAWPLPKLRDRGMMWFVARHEIDYRAETYAGDQLFMVTWLDAVRGARVWRQTMVFRPTNGRSPDADSTLICAARTRWAFVDLTTRRPIPVPADIVQTFEAAR